MVGIQNWFCLNLIIQIFNLIFSPKQLVLKIEELIFLLKTWSNKKTNVCESKIRNGKGQ